MNSGCTETSAREAALELSTVGLQTPCWELSVADCNESPSKNLAFHPSAGRREFKTPYWKRAIDIAVSLALIVALAPLLALIAAFIWWRDGGPVLFKQPRLGLMGQSFVIYKFRTLRLCEAATTNHRQYVAGLSSDNGVTNKPDLTSRAIPGGNFLRSTSLDELPQLWNILRGDMSLIGPRPDVLEWDDYKPWHLRRFEVLPGVTGLWQVSGKNRLTFNEMIEKDIEYVDNRSLMLDLRIALRTFRLLLKRENH